MKSKSRSEQSFERVEYDDAPNQAGYGSQEFSANTSPDASRAARDAAGEGQRTTSGSWVPAGVSGWFSGGSPGVEGPGDARRERNTGDDDPTHGGKRVSSKGWTSARDVTEAIVGSAQDYYDGSGAKSSGFDRGR